MPGESQADVYASFGVQSVVLSGNNIEEHRQVMLSHDVSVRDHDDLIELRQPQENEDADVTVTDRTVDPYATEDDRTEINIPTEGELPLTDEGDPEVQPEANADEGADDFGPALGDAPEALVTASQQISEYADGLAEMKAQAIENGLSAEMAAQIEAEYEANSALSEASLKALEDAGFKRGFVKSFLQGQESMANAYVGQIVEYAGGKATFDKLVAHLTTNSPETVEVLEDAIQRQDLKAIKATINLAKASHKAKFGASPARNVAAKAPATPARAAAPKVEGFTSQDAMVEAMSDPRYGRDPAYRQSVIQKVAASNW